MKKKDLQLSRLLRLGMSVILLNLLYFTASAQITIPAGNPNGTGASTIEARMPYTSFFGYVRSTFIYLNSEIGMSGNINTIGFYVNTVSAPAAVPMTIYLKQTSAANFGTTTTTVATELTGATQVWTGTIPVTAFTANTWVTVTLPTPWTYSNASNLQVIVVGGCGGGGCESGTGKQFRYTDQGSGVNRMQYWQADSNPPTGTGTLSRYRQNIQLGITALSQCGGTPAAGTISTSAGNTFCGSANSTLTLSGHSTDQNISLQWQSSTDGTNWTNIGTLNATSYSVTGLTTSTLYRVRVTCANSGITSIAGPILLNVSPNPVVGVTQSSPYICTTGGSVTLTATGASSYLWSPATGLSSTTAATVTANPTVSTAYTVAGTLGSCTVSVSTGVNIGSGPAITTTATPSTICSGSNSQLATTTAPTTYQVYPIAPVMLTIPSPTTASTLTDDNSSGLIAMPFNFTYFGNSYSQVVIASNGYIGFTDVDMSNRFVAAIPTTGTPNNCIYAFWKDLQINILNGSVTYGTVGTAPNRKFVVSFNPALDFNVSTSTPANSHTGQIILHETTNYIDVIIQNSSSGTRTLGIENSTGTVAVTPPGRNYTAWSVSAPGEGWRFAIPTYNYAWSPASDLSSTTIANPVATALTANTTKNVIVTDNVTGCTSTGSATVTVNPLPTATLTSGSPATICAGQQPVLNFTGTPNSNVVYSIGGINQPAVTLNGTGTATVTAPAISAATTYALVSVTNPATTCSQNLTGSFSVGVNPRPQATFNGTSTICKDQQAYISFNATSGGPTIYVTYSDGTTTYMDTATSSNQNFEVPSSTSGTYLYNITAMTSANGCAAVTGDYSGTATVVIKDRPDVTVTSDSTAVCQNGSTNINFTFTGDAPFLFNYFDGTTNGIPGSTSSNTFSFTPSVTGTTTYYVEYLQDANPCYATPGIELLDSVTVTNHDTATITVQPQATINACSENAVVISMAATGYNLTYTWYENGVAIPTGTPGYIISNNTLTINNVTGLDSNTYYVEVQGQCGNVQTSTTTTITEDQNNSWTGTVSDDWSNPMNWSCGSVPIVTTDVTISGTPANQPRVDIGTAVCNNLSIVGANTLSFDAGQQLTVHGNIVNAGGTVDGTGGTIELAGTTQTVSGPVTLGGLEVNGGGVKTFNNDVLVNGILNLVSGNIELGATNLTLAQPATQQGGSASSFIVTNGTGRVTGNNMGVVGGNPGAVMFHVGINGGSYTPITLENFGDADNFTVTVKQNVYEDGTGVNPAEVTNPVVDRTWLVEEGTAGGSVVSMSPYWNSSDEINGFDQTHVYVAHYWNGEWISYVDSANAAPAATAAGPMWTTTQDSIMNFSPFTVASGGQFPLAIRLASITATNAGNRNKVQWRSETEDKGDIYELESSADGRKFSKIATVAANGKPSTYVQWDENPVMGVNYYRVKLLNNDGTHSYSKVVTATVKGKDGFSIEAYPNPVSSTVSVNVNGVVKGNATVLITDVTGKVVKEKVQVIDNNATINVSNLASGIYMINYSDDVRNETIKITKQ